MHEITTDAQGNRHGSDGQHTVSLHGQAGQMFKRRAIKHIGTEQTQEICWLVAELNGVRVYQHAQHVIVTTEDLYP